VEQAEELKALVKDIFADSLKQQDEKLKIQQEEWQNTGLTQL